ncbi:unnamed protein product [Periconia digitata]|uniref:Uncharacterized protein n=1 Tax=Periconia digitata TaxID=1303443 RepID=A0A9W4U1G3_9PLEO|nr:unnamed protein product [Periconia digitata]
MMWWTVFARSLVQAWRDFISVFSTWRRWVFALVYFGWFFVLFNTLGIFGYPGFNYYSTACAPGGEFLLFPGGYSPWSASGFFQVGLSFGELTFGQAKGIDIAWDIVAGRGGQFIMAWMSWRTFVYYLTTSMETGPVTYSSFRAVFIEKGPSITSIVRLIRDFVSRKGLRSQIASVFIIASMAFILAFPTLASAMSGYTSVVAAQIVDPESNMIPFTKFGLVVYTIHDGDRIGERKDFPVIHQNDAEDPYAWFSATAYKSYISPTDRSNTTLLDCIKYVERFTDMPKDEPSQFGNWTLDAPTLNITSYFDDIGHQVEGRNLSWVYDGVFYDQQYFEAEVNGIRNGTCQPTQKYSWGFSYTQLFIVVVLLILWSIGLSIMYVDAKRTMFERGRSSVDGEYKAVISLAAAIEKDLNLNLHAPGTESGIRNRVRAARGGSVVYSAPKSFRYQTKRHRLKMWLRTEKWWLLVMLLPVVYIIVNEAIKRTQEVGSFRVFYIRNYLSIGFSGPLCGVVIALLMGTTTGSRVVYITICTVVTFVGFVPFALA